MPGGYGTDESTPWGAAGTSYVSPGQSSSPYQPGAGSTNKGGSNAVADAVNTYQQNPTPQNQQVAQAAIDEQTPDPGYQTFEELAALASSDPKYGKSWDFNPDNPNNWIGYETQYNLGKFVATDSSGNPIRDSEGNYILTGLGKHIEDQGQGSGINLENLQGIEKEYYAMRDAQQAQQTGGDQGYGYGYDPGSGGGGGYSVAGVHPRSFYKGLQYQDFSGKEVQKMLHFGQKIDAANVLSGLSQGAQAFAMDPKARGIMAVLTA